MQYGKTCKFSFHSVLLLVLLIPGCFPARGQSARTTDDKKNVKSKSAKDAEVAKAEFNVQRWRSLLDSLLEDAKSIIEKEKYSQVLAEIADAWWKLDKDKASQLFSKALDAALEIDPKNKFYEPSIKKVINLATRRDQILSRSLMKKVIELKEKNPKTNVSPASVALDFLNEDIKLAAEIAEAGKAAGASLNLGYFLIQLAKKDMNAANRVYMAYLLQMRVSPRIPLEQLLYLGGFPFGYGETQGGSIDITRMSGISGMRIDGLVPNPDFINKYLETALLSVQQVAAELEKLPAAEKELYATLGLFATTCSLPEVELYTPAQAPLWMAAHQQFLLHASPAGQEKVAVKIKEIKASRAVVREHTSTQDYIDRRTLSLLEEAEKLPDGCKRDRAYAQAALSIGAKDFQRAQGVVEQIKDISLRDNVLQFLYYNLAMLAVKEANFEDAYLYSEKLKAVEQKTILYIRIAQKALEKKDEARAREYLINMGLLADKISSPAEQVTVWLAAAAVFATFDRTKTKEALYTAIRTGNKVAEQNIDSFTVKREVDLTCGAEDMWYGGSDEAEKISLIQTLSTLSVSEPEEIINLAYYIEDRSNRCRALAAIAKSVLENKMPKASAK
jgi:hypothetical protein